MRALLVSGAILVIVGILLILKPPSYSREESVFKLGNIEAKMQDERTIPGWIGGVFLGVGGVLVVLGLKRPSGR